MKTAHELLDEANTLLEGIEDLTDEEQEILRDFLGDWITQEQADIALDDLYEGIPYNRENYEN